MKNAPPCCLGFRNKGGVFPRNTPDPLLGSPKIQGSNYRLTEAASMPPDPFGKNQLFCEGEGEEGGHQFFFTTGRKERFAQK